MYFNIYLSLRFQKFNNYLNIKVWVLSSYSFFSASFDCAISTLKSGIHCEQKSVKSRIWNKIYYAVGSYRSVTAGWTMLSVGQVLSRFRAHRFSLVFIRWTLTRLAPNSLADRYTRIGCISMRLIRSAHGHERGRFVQFRIEPFYQYLSRASTQRAGSQCGAQAARKKSNKKKRDPWLKQTSQARGTPRASIANIRGSSHGCVRPKHDDVMSVVWWPFDGVTPTVSTAIGHVALRSDSRE